MQRNYCFHILPSTSEYFPDSARRMVQTASSRLQRHWQLGSTQTLKWRVRAQSVPLPVQISPQPQQVPWFANPVTRVNCETQRLIDQQPSSFVFPCCSLSLRPASVTSPLYDVLGHTNHTFSESSRSKDIKTDNTKCLMH